MARAQKVFVSSSETGTESIVLEGGCGFYQLMFGRCSDRSSVQNIMDRKMTATSLRQFCAHLNSLISKLGLRQN